MKLTSPEIDFIIGESTGNKYNNLASARKALLNFTLPANELLTQLTNKITKQIIIQNLQFENPFDNAFITENLEAGSVAEVITNDISTIEDYEPNGYVPPTNYNKLNKQYAFQFDTLIKKQIDRQVSEEIFVGAFLNATSFNSFFADYSSRLMQTWNLWFWQYISQTILKNVKNVINGVTDKTGDYPDKTLREALTEIYKLQAQMSNPSSDFNVGAVKGAATFDYNGITYNVKTNNTPENEAIILIRPELRRQIELEVLMSEYHNEFFAFQGHFSKVLPLPNSYSTENGLPDPSIPTGKEKIIILDKRAFAIFVRINTAKTLPYLNLNMITRHHFWYAMGLILCNNGFAYDFTLVDETVGQKVSIISPLDSGAVSVKEKTNLTIKAKNNGKNKE